MNRKLTFVLSGGGSRGSLQVGALYALLEYGLEPDLVVGTSIGAVNATFIALHDFSKDTLDLLTETWRRASALDLLPSDYIQRTLRAMLRRSSFNASERIKDFFVQNGLDPELCFSDVKNPQLRIVSSDLNTGKPVLHGESEDACILEALLLSTALPPWNMPVIKQSQFLMDGGVLSNLPVEPALRAGATHIIALDLLDAREYFGTTNRFGHFLDRLSFAIMQRQVDMELALAKACGVPVFYLDLTGKEPIPLWDFKSTEELIARGYEMMKDAISQGSLREVLSRD